MRSYINPDDVKRVMAKQMERVIPHLEDAGFRGVSARATHTLYAPINLWRLEETNRDSDPNDVINAMVGLLASAVCAQLLELVCEDCREQVAAQIAEHFCNRLRQMLATEVEPGILDIIEGIRMGNA